VTSETVKSQGFDITRVRITNAQSGEKLGKPPGIYVTMDVNPGVLPPDRVAQAAQALGEELKRALGVGPGGLVMVCGLGNRDVTPDCIGPLALEHVMVTRHLATNRELFGELRPVCALAPGVLGSTGIESAEILRSVCERVRPDAVIVIDALASRRVDRLCATVQISDAGIVPGSGVGNSRAALNKETMGVPVVAVGVPTVVDAATLACDLLEKSGMAPPPIKDADRALMVTPREIDKRAADMAKLIGYAVDLCLQDGYTWADVSAFLS